MTTTRKPKRIVTDPYELRQQGKLEQTCPDCGRWEAASSRCSWCHRPMTPADWYRNGLVAERKGRRPSAAPANPPTEYRAVSAWPETWGPCPFVSRRTAASDPSKAVAAAAAPALRRRRLDCEH